MSTRELEEYADGSRKRVNSVVFGSGDGVRSVECNGSTYPAAMRSQDGRLWRDAMAKAGLEMEETGTRPATIYFLAQKRAAVAAR